jgi:hypothetical protein
MCYHMIMLRCKRTWTALHGLALQLPPGLSRRAANLVLLSPGVALQKVLAAPGGKAR